MLGKRTQSALKRWQEKLAEYQNEEAITSDPEKKFQLKKLIDECKQKIRELKVQQEEISKKNENEQIFAKESLFKQLFVPKQWGELKFLGLLLFLSLLHPIQDLLLESRLYLQARYRQVTDQIPAQIESPLLLIQIDDNSLDEDKVQPRHPINYSYLARLVEKSSNLGTKVVGIDYVLDDKDQPENSQKLAKTLSQVQENQPETRFVFAAINSEDSSKGSISKDIVTIDSKRYHKGDIDFYQWYVELPDYYNDSHLKPFAYLLALNYSCLVNDKSTEENRTQPKSKRPKDCSPFSNNDPLFHFLSSLKLLSLSRFSQWFQPIIDFSIPPDKAYQTISACEFLETCATEKIIPESLQSQIVLIAAGGYEEAGLKQQGEDNYPTPLAVNFWSQSPKEEFPGGQAHAYMIHHFLTQRLVIPIPDFLMVLLAALLGKRVFLILLKNPRQQKQWLIGLGGSTVFYLWLCLQFYISLGVVIPLLLPSIVLGNYVRLALRRKSHE